MCVSISLNLRFEECDTGILVYVLEYNDDNHSRTGRKFGEFTQLSLRPHLTSTLMRFPLSLSGTRSTRQICVCHATSSFKLAREKGHRSSKPEQTPPPSSLTKTNRRNNRSRVYIYNSQSTTMSGKAVSTGGKFGCSCYRFIRAQSTY